jgi:hypothetical protein
MRKLLFFAVLVSGCSANYKPTGESVAIKKETKRLLNSKVDRMAGIKTGGLTYYFILNENKSFSAVVDMDDSKQYDFCAGTYQYNYDTLNLNYYKNYKSKYFTDKAVIDNNNNEIVFINTDDSTKNRRIKFLDQL